MMEFKTTQSSATIGASIHRFSSDDATLKAFDDEVIVEQAIHLRVEDVGSFTLFCTPVEIIELAVGFLFTEGFIQTVEDIVDIQDYQPDTQTISIKLTNNPETTAQRNLVMTNGYGFCGKRNIEKVFKTIPACREKFLFYADSIDTVFEQFHHSQVIFKKTGASHAAALFDEKGQILLLSEDMGRHNALDKLIGKRLLEGSDFKRLGLALSGRVSFDLMIKAARAQLELVAAISAPTSLAIEAAKKWNITLCGFVRSGRVNVYYDSGAVRDGFTLLNSESH